VESIIEFIFELLLQLLLEIFGQIIFELATAFGSESLKDSVRRKREATPLVSGIGHFLMGLLAGGLSLLLFGSRLTRPGPFPGVSLIVSPLGTGLAMHWLGELQRDQGNSPPRLFTFRAGAIFAFGMALVRFLYLERPWF
jgi:hypothetical protein